MVKIDKDELIREISNAIKRHENDRTSSAAPTDAKDYAKYRGILGGLNEALEIVTKHG